MFPAFFTGTVQLVLLPTELFKVKTFKK